MRFSGYVVTGLTGPYRLCNWGDAITLATSDRFTVFETRKQAKRAIRKTLKYAADNKLNWDNDFEIIPLEKAKHG